MSFFLPFCVCHKQKLKGGRNGKVLYSLYGILRYFRIQFCFKNNFYRTHATGEQEDRGIQKYRLGVAQNY